MKLRPWAALTLAWALSLGTAAAEDWPQLGGPRIDLNSTDVGLAEDWPRGGPPLVWETTGLGGGFASPVVAGGRVFIVGRRIKGAIKGDWCEQPVEPGSDVLTCLDRATGKALWRHEFASFTGRTATAWSTPAADERFVYARAGDGEVRCLAAQDGRLAWSWPKDKTKTNPRLRWETAGGLFLLDDLVYFVFAPHLVALDRTTGEERWVYKYPAVPGWGSTAQNVMFPEVKGKTRLLISGDLLDPATGQRVGALPPDTGALSWWAACRGGQLVSACSTGITCQAFDAAADGSVTSRCVWQWTGTGAVGKARGGKGYGGPLIMSGRVFVWLGGAGGDGPACLDLATGRELWWDKPTVGGISYTLPLGADGKILILFKGRLRMFAPTPAGLKELAAARVSRSSWAAPAIADGRLFIRDDGGTVKCLDLRAKREPRPAAAPVAAAPVESGSWPQADGPFGDRTAPDRGLLESWPSNGLRVAWQAAASPGPAAPVVAAGRVLLLGRRDYGIKTDAQGQPAKAADGKIVYENSLSSGTGPLTLSCLDRKTGARLWEFAFATNPPPNKATSVGVAPVVEAGRVYVADWPRELVCLDAADGKVVWRKPDPDQILFGEPLGLPAGAERLALCGDRLIGAGDCQGALLLAAFDKLTGEPAWTKFVETPNEQRPTTPGVLRGPTGACLLQVCQGALTVIAPDGGMLGELRGDDMQFGGYSPAAFTVSGPRLYAHRQKATECLELNPGAGEGAPALKKIWTCEAAPGGTMIPAGDRLMVFDARMVKARQAATGKLLWDGAIDNGPVVGGVVADSQLILLTGKGELVLIRTDAPEFRIVARTPIAGLGPCWTPPSLSAGQLFVRDAAGRVACLDVKKP